MRFHPARRDFLKGLAIAGFAGAVPGCTSVTNSAANSAGGRSLSKMGIQLYTLRELFAADPEATLASIAAIGFKKVEGTQSALEQLGPAQMKALADRHGLGIPACHITIGTFLADTDLQIHRLRTVGASYGVVPWIGEADRNPDGWRRVAGELNVIGERLAAADLTLAYHNHHFEFDRLADGSTGMDILLAETDQNLVKFELDVYWVAKAQIDPVSWLTVHGDRVSLCHLKDIDSMGDIANVGSGTLDFRSILQSATDAGIEHFFVEHDNPPQPHLEAVKASFDHLQALRF